MATEDIWRMAQAVRRRPEALVLWRGLRAQPLGITSALVATWLGLALAVEAAAAGALGGGLWVLGAFTIGHASERIFSHMVTTPFGVGADGALLIFSVLLGVVGGAVGGYTAASFYLLASPSAVCAGLICGSLVALVIVTGLYRCEHWLLLRCGYRRMAWEEDQRVRPLVEEAGAAMGIDLDELAPILIKDTALPDAHAHMRVIVLSRGLLAMLNDAQLAGVLAHELAHWRAADAVGNSLVWAGALPLALIHGLLDWVGRHTRSTVINGLLWILFWPVDVSIRLIIAPAFARNSRRNEYAADAAAAAAGAHFREGLKSGLQTLAVLEAPRNGWEEALRRAHPPTALRLERLVSADEAQHRATIAAGRATAKKQRQLARKQGA